MKGVGEKKLSPHRHKNGYVVEGVATGSREVETWYAHNLQFANNLAELLVKETGEEADIYKYIGTWKRQETPVEFVPAEEE